MARLALATTSIVIVCVVVYCVSYAPSANAARILGVFPSHSKSHLLIHCAIADTLAQAGHNVTVIADIANLYKRAKYRYIQIDANAFDASVFQQVVNQPLPYHQRFKSIVAPIVDASNKTLSHATMQKFLRAHGAGSFDLLILGYFMNDFYLGLGAHFACPMAISFMIQPIGLVNDMLGNPSEAAYVPVLFSGLLQPMSFMHRVQNLLTRLFEQYVLTNMLNSYTKHYYNYHFPADRYPSLDAVRKNVSLVFVNHHSISQGPIRPNVPNLIEIGGIQIKEKPDPLPADIAKTLNESKEGVIYFSLGSNIQGTHLSAEKAKIMFNVISKLPYKVLWKWGDSDFPGQSANIIYKSWLPQDDILAHPNLKLFITHGGQGSVVESQYHGVPMVGIPLFGDQHSNMANVERAGFGLTVDYLSMTEESLNKAIREVLQNPKYTNAVRAFSTLYRDRPMTPRQSVNYWVNYVLRHNGARHMQSPAIHMNRWQLLSLDVIAFLLSIVVIVVGVFVKLCKFLCCRKRTKQVKKQVSKGKKNK